MFGDGGFQVDWCDQLRVATVLLLQKSSLEVISVCACMCASVLFAHRYV